MEVERSGVPSFVAEIVRDALGISTRQFALLVGVSESTCRRRISRQGGKFPGSSALAILGTMELLDFAKNLPDPHCEAAADFDAGKWFGAWIERAQPALGGARPVELMATPTGRRVVRRILGAIASGAYQ